MAKAILVRLSGLYATKLRYGGHGAHAQLWEISKFANTRIINSLIGELMDQFPTPWGPFCYINPSIFPEMSTQDFNKHDLQTRRGRPSSLEPVLDKRAE
jgi:flagellar motor switch protein FliM